MLAKVALRAYLTGIGVSGLYGVYLANNDYENENKCETNIKYHNELSKEFLDYSLACGTGLYFGIFCGALLPVSILGKTFSLINKKYIIQKDICTKNK